VILCDCPGLVFPNFATTKADLVTNGVLPIDQMREFAGPVGLVTLRIPRNFLEATYGIRIKMRPIEEGGTGIPTSEELLRAYASARGFHTQGLGQPDESRAARYVLKDYVNGKLLYVEPPPESGIDPKTFNQELYDEFHLPEKRRAALVSAVDSLSLEKDTDAASMASEFIALPQGPKSERIDRGFFGPESTQGHVSMPFNHKYTEQGKDKLISGRKARTLVALENGIDPKDVQVVSSKKHFKGGSRSKKGKKKSSTLDDD
jgi:large subunit GTPase 1